MIRQLLFSLICASAFAQGPSQYGTADDGTPLRWIATYPHDGQPKHPSVLLIPGGGFIALNTIPNQVVMDVVSAGYNVYNMVQYRLAPPSKLPGQKSDGRYPNQTDDVTIAASTAQNDSHCNGQVFVIGGSAGASHAAVLAARGLVVAAALLSPAMQFDDPTSLKNPQFAHSVTNYASDLSAASPNNMLVANEAPIFIAAFQFDSMPSPQYATAVDKLESLHASYISRLVTGNGHAWSMWNTVKDQVISFINSHSNQIPQPTPSATCP